MQIHKLNISGYCFLFALSQIFLCVGALPAGKPKTLNLDGNAEDKSVIIVGAGVSGLIAAETLRKAGGFSVTVLEAMDSIGGRVQTRKIGNHYVEFGAEWVHGNIDNSIYELMEPYGVFINKSESGDGYNGTENFLEMKNIFANQFGEEMADEFRDQMQKIFNAIYQDDEEGRKLFALTKEKFANKSESVGEFVIALFEEFISENPIHERESVIAAALDFLERKVNIEDSADSWFVTSNAEDGERYEYCEGDQENAWKPTATYFALLKVILGQWETGPSEPGVIIIPPWIQLQSEVVEIQHSSTSEEPVTVTLADGTKYTADHVISTVSLGVMKERHSTLFQPNLSPKKQLAIQHLGYGTVDKIYLEFESQWWFEVDQNFTGIYLLWEYNKTQAEEIQIPGWFRSIEGIGLVDSKSHPFVLQGWISGFSARLMETLSIDQVTQDVLFILRTFLKERFPNIPDPIRVTRSTWYSNPFTRGSYSFQTLDSDFYDVWARDLAMPILNEDGKPVVVFAGEATHEHYYSTVHGAYDTGIRAAEKCIEWNLP